MTEKMVKWKEFVFHSFEYFPFYAMWKSTFFPQGPQKGGKSLKSGILLPSEEWCSENGFFFAR